LVRERRKKEERVMWLIFLGIWRRVALQVLQAVYKTAYKIISFHARLNLLPWRWKYRVLNKTQCTYNVTLRRVRVTIVAVEK
jgi:hypothetical protein